MKLYGYCENAEEDEETPLQLGEVTLCADPQLLRRLSKFLATVADQMERHGDDFGHEHFEDFEEPSSPQPSFIVVPEARSGVDVEQLNEPGWLRVKLLLAFQKALLGEVSQDLVAVGIIWSTSSIEARFYYDREPEEEERERVSEIETEVLAGFPQQSVRCMVSERLLKEERDELMELVYLRSES